jgi:serine/threonine protein kinase
MPLSVGARLGSYEILSLIGAGGMGEVYRARDTRLDRDVALKILPEAFAADADRMARFEREAKLLAALNHPNIAAIYGLEQSALVMELVEGPTVAERIAQGRIPLEEALEIAKQIADAVQYAHRRGIIHRDLKPANIKVNSEGSVKVLDFGLARAVSIDLAAADPVSSPTLTMRATQAGVIMGTAAYMAPEQARGHQVDERADIWSFGVVLYEMLTGRTTFTGQTVSDTLASVLKTDPDWSALPTRTPAAIRRLLRRCLERDRERRLHNIADARLEIEEALMAPPEQPPVAEAARARGAGWPVLVPLSLLALAGLVVAVMHFREAPPETAVVRFQIPPPEKAQFGAEFRVTLSPDGRRIAFSTVNSVGRLSLWVRSLDSVDARPLPGTENSTGPPFWSPDGRWIGFAADGKLKKVEVSGGPPQTLCSVDVRATTGAWNRDGVILFGSFAGGSGIFRVSQAGGEKVQVTTLDRSRQEFSHASPQFLPDGRHFLYLAGSPVTENIGTYLATLDGKERKLLLRNTTAAAYAPPATSDEKVDLLFLRDGTLMAQPLDTSTFDLTGEASPVAEQVGSFRSYGYFSASANGVLAYRSGTMLARNSQLTWFDRAGKPQGQLGPTGPHNDVALSPDGKGAAFDADDPQTGNRDIWLLDVARGVTQRFTSNPAQDWFPVWSPDASKLLFASSRDGPSNIYQKDSSGTVNEEALLKSDLNKYPLDWSPDGRSVIYQVVNPQTRSELWVVPLEAERGAGSQKPGTPTPLLQTTFNETQGQFSRGREGAPSGAPRWVMYSSDDSGAWQIYVQPFSKGASGAGRRVQISTNGGSQPRWSADGKELFYVAPDGNLMAVEVKLSPRFEAGVPKALFPTRILAGPNDRHLFRYAVAPDGKRFLINTPTQAAESNASPITVVLNWTAVLKRR